MDCLCACVWAWAWVGVRACVSTCPHLHTTQITQRSRWRQRCPPGLWLFVPHSKDPYSLHICLLHILETWYLEANEINHLNIVHIPVILNTECFCFFGCPPSFCSHFIQSRVEWCSSCLPAFGNSFVTTMDNTVFCSSLYIGFSY